MIRKSQSFWSIASRLSLGFVLVLFWAWMYLKADLLFPVNTATYQAKMLFYMVFSGFILSWDTLASKKVETPLFKISFLKAFPKFLLSAGITMAILYIFGLLYKGSALATIKTAVATTGIGVLIFYAFFVAILEEKIFRNWVPRQLEAGVGGKGIPKAGVWVLQAVIFALFHYAFNRQWLSLVIYIPLGFIFMYAREKWSPDTDMVNSGIHFSWDVFLLGFLGIS